MAVDFSRDFDFQPGLNDGVGATLTFGRASEAQHYNGDGTLIAAASGAPRLLSHRHNGIQFNNRGLLIERAATNVVPDSDMSTFGTTEVTIEETFANDIDNQGFSGVQIQDTTSGSTSHLIGRSDVAMTNGVEYVYSVIAKYETIQWLALTTNGVIGAPRAFFDIQNVVLGVANYDESLIEDLGNGWVKCSIRYTVDAVTGDKSINLYMAMADNSFAFVGDQTHTMRLAECQVEVGPSSTKPIDTVSAAVTRLVETCTAAFVPNDPCTIYLEGETNLVPGVMLQIDDGTEDERYRVERVADNSIVVTVTDGGVEQAAVDAGSVADQTFFRLAIRIADGDFSASLDGAAVVTDGAGTLPTLTTLRLGGDTASGEEWNSYITKVYVYDTGFTDAELTALAASGLATPGSGLPGDALDHIRGMMAGDALLDG